MTWEFFFDVENGILEVATPGDPNNADLNRMAVEIWAELRRVGSVKLLFDSRRITGALDILDARSIPVLSPIRF